QRLTEPDDDLPVPESRKINAARLGIGAERSHLDDHVCGLKHFGPASPAGAACPLLVIGESGLHTGRPLDDDASAQFGQCITVARRDGHAPLAREGFARYSNRHSHEVSPTFISTQRFTKPIIASEKRAPAATPCGATSLIRFRSRAVSSIMSAAKFCYRLVC